jgi:hypothetical protein
MGPGLGYYWIIFVVDVLAEAIKNAQSGYLFMLVYGVPFDAAGDNGHNQKSGALAADIQQADRILEGSCRTTHFGGVSR